MNNSMNYTQFKLRDLLTIKNGKDYKTEKKGQIPVYGTGGIIAHVDNYLYDGESILLPRKGSLQNIEYVSGKFWTVDTIYWSEINKEVVYPKYLYLYLSLLDLSHLDSGSALPSMTFNSYYEIVVCLPDIEKQRKIADFIFYFIDVIKNKKKQIETLESIAKTIYSYWFVQFDFPNEEGKPYKSSGGKMVWNEELKREIPEGWNVEPLKAIVKSVNTGLNPRDNFKLNSGGDIRYLTVKNITAQGTIDFSNCDYIDDVALKIVHERSDIKVGDLLFASISPLGRCYYIMKSPYKWDINESLFSIRPNTKSSFLYMFLTSEFFIKKAENSSTGSIFKGIRIKSLLDLKMYIPPHELVTKFDSIVTKLLISKSSASDENQELTNLKEFMIPLLMNGQVTLN